MKGLRVFVGCLLVAGCSAAPQKLTPYPVKLVAQSDNGEPVQGAAFKTGDNEMGTTDHGGQVTVVVHGREGALVPIQVTCPRGFVSPPEGTLRLGLVKSLDSTTEKQLEHKVICDRETRSVAIVIRAQGGPKLPVLVDGKQVTATDENGNAHVAMEVARDSTRLAVSLDTSDDQTLRPQNPYRAFELDGVDQFFVFDPLLAQVRVRHPPTRRAVRSKAPVPYRMR